MLFNSIALKYRIVSRVLPIKNKSELFFVFLEKKRFLYNSLMDNFIVSARKYRPSTFNSVVGQKSITTTLKNAIKTNQLAQAFLFCGPRGVGKTTCARILAKTINCENLTEDFEACNECVSCKSFNESTSFNVHELDAASNNSVDDIRNLVDQVRIPPQSARYKVYIIDEVHMLSAAAFNAFLKTLEEPPPYAKFILATTEKHKILPTILSRCQIYDFRRINLEDIADHLAYVAKSESINYDEEALHIIAQKADGGLRDALSMFDQLVNSTGHDLTYKSVIENLNVLDFEFYFRITEALLTGNVSAALLTLNEVIENGFDGQHFLTGLASHLRNILVCKDAATVKLLEVSQVLRTRFLEQSKVCPLDFIIRSLDIANKCDLSYRTSSNKRLHIEIALLQMTRMNPQSSPQSLPPPQPQHIPTPVVTPQQVKAQDTTRQTPPVGSYSPNAAPQAVVNDNKANEYCNQPVQQNVNPGFAKPDEPSNRSGSLPQTTSIRSNGNQTLPTTTKISPTTSAPGSAATVKVRLSDSAISDNDDVESDEELESGINESSSAYTSVNKPVTQISLEQAWETLQKRFPDLITLTFRKPILNEGYKIIYPIVSKLEETEVIQNRYEILLFLKQELGNHQIELDTLLTEEAPQERKAFTDKDKYERLVSRNPLLQKFREKFDLELLY
jgi:DNA polymerase-3 subunit gamma/tau